MLNYIVAHWVEWVFAGITGLATLGYRSVLRKLQEERVRNEAIAEGVQSLLRDTIVTNYNKYQDKGYCPIYAKESAKKIYEAYHKLGGNDIATGLYMKLIAMPECIQDDEMPDRNKKGAR